MDRIVCHDISRKGVERITRIFNITTDNSYMRPSIRTDSLFFSGPKNQGISSHWWFGDPKTLLCRVNPLFFANEPIDK